jgi:hypothetical protein
MRISNKKPVLVQMKDGYRLLFNIILTVEKGPTLCAGRAVSG